MRGGYELNQYAKWQELELPAKKGSREIVCLGSSTGSYGSGAYRNSLIGYCYYVMK